MRHQIILLAGMGFAVAAPAIAVAQSALPEIKSQATAQAVLDEHMDALNHCDWNRIVAQYPDDAQINLPGGAVVAGARAYGLRTCEINLEAADNADLFDEQRLGPASETVPAWVGALMGAESRCR